MYEKFSSLILCKYASFATAVHADGSLGRGLQWQRYRRGGPGSAHGAATEMSSCKTVRNRPRYCQNPSYVCMYVCMYACMYVYLMCLSTLGEIVAMIECILLYLYTVCMYVCMYARINMYNLFLLILLTHTYIHTYKCILKNIQIRT